MSTTKAEQAKRLATLPSATEELPADPNELRLDEEGEIVDRDGKRIDYGIALTVLREKIRVEQLASMGYDSHGRKIGALAHRHEPTPLIRRIIANAASMGMTADQISSLTGLSVKLIFKHYKYEFEHAGDIRNLRVANNLFNIATDPKHKGSVGAAIFWLKTRGNGNWKETSAVELTGKDGKPLNPGAAQLTNVIDSAKLTMEERANLRELMAKAQRPALTIEEKTGRVDDDDISDGEIIEESNDGDAEVNADSEFE